MTTERYLMLLRENLSNAVAPLRGSGETLTFMQDNATYHTAYKVINWLGQNHIKQIVWPPQSPDLSLIENVWASIKNELWNQRADINSPEDAWKKALKISQNLTFAYVNNLYNSIPKRIEELSKRNGSRINYTCFIRFTGQRCHFTFISKHFISIVRILNLL